MDPTLTVSGVTLVEGGQLKKKRVIRVYGSVPSAAQKERILKLVQKRAGNAYVIMDYLFVSDVLWDR